MWSDTREKMANRGAVHEACYNRSNEQHMCFLCHNVKRIVRSTSIIISRENPFDTITREYCCISCLDKLPTDNTKKATEDQSDKYLEKFMNSRFGG